MIGKPVKSSRIDGHVHEIYPNDLNPNDTVFGGRIMEIADMLGAACAKLHTECTCATVIVDSMRFLSPAKRGEILMFFVSINRTWKTSMEIGVKVVASAGAHKPSRKVLSAFFTFVALNNLNKPTEVLPIIPETDEEKRRYEEADIRRQERIRLAKAKEAALKAKNNDKS
ncbi:MAG: hypothetical protein S4CHLAM7_01400 [Chlamydiae bacterium]|nr:hypothetical protein [Chlamydiota bacterium]